MILERMISKEDLKLHLINLGISNRMINGSIYKQKTQLKVGKEDFVLWFSTFFQRLRCLLDILMCGQSRSKTKKQN